jgi:hypothetical protein
VLETVYVAVVTNPEFHSARLSDRMYREQSLDQHWYTWVRRDHQTVILSSLALEGRKPPEAFTALPPSVPSK